MLTTISKTRKVVTVAKAQQDKNVEERDRNVEERDKNVTTPKGSARNVAVLDHETDGKSKSTDEHRTLDQVIESLKGYVLVEQEMWSMIPVGSHIRYERKFAAGQPDSKSVSKAASKTGVDIDLFRMGGFVTNRDTVDNKPMVWLENRPGVNKRLARNAPRPQGYSRWGVNMNEVERIWKKLDANSFIELTLVQNSLLHKQKQIDALEQRIAALEKH